ncbi:hypothetical protein PHMEG_00030524 [Phytophthora megakarya]|uniref:Uncharacterized protein n=1 Tax=Phytophthora megakarya TaxID=4795 RepID=A0A225V130_9STRA|nr:hypothetical protein PHMEG_00030524 [Phytophthora megakarya]
MSGRVHLAIQSRLPTKDWNIFTMISSPLPTAGNKSTSDSSASSFHSAPIGVREPFASSMPSTFSISTIMTSWSRSYPFFSSSCPGTCALLLNPSRTATPATDSCSVPVTSKSST